MLALKGCVKVFPFEYAVGTHEGLLLVGEIRFTQQRKVKEKNKKKETERDRPANANHPLLFTWLICTHILLNASPFFLFARKHGQQIHLIAIRIHESIILWAKKKKQH